MKAVVTGASGHIGACLVRALLERGDRVRVVRHFTTRGVDGLEVESVRGDVLDRRSLVAAFAGCDVLFHLAAVISIAGDPRGLVRAVNVKGAENTARAARTAGIRRMVHCSSVHAFDMSGGGSIDETCPRVPEGSRQHTEYDRSKADGERRVRAVFDEGLDGVVVHPTGVIGPLDFEPSHLGRFFLRLRDRRLPSLVHGRYDFVDARDVAAGLIAAGEGGRRGHSYLLGGHVLSIRGLADLAQAATGVPSPRWTVPIPVAQLALPFIGAAARLTGNEPLYTRESLKTIARPPAVDCSRAVRELGYEARPASETVADVYRWFEEAGV